MATLLHIVLMILMLSGKGQCQCYSAVSCGGSVVQAVDQRDCCVTRSGHSFSGAGTCQPWIGMEYSRLSERR